MKQLTDRDGKHWVVEASVWYFQAPWGRVRHDEKTAQLFAPYTSRYADGGMVPHSPFVKEDPRVLCTYYLPDKRTRRLTEFG